MYVRLFGHLIFLSFISALHATVACLRATLSASDNFAASADIGINEPAMIATNKDLTVTRYGRVAVSSCPDLFLIMYQEDKSQPDIIGGGTIGKGRRRTISCVRQIRSKGVPPTRLASERPLNGRSVKRLCAMRDEMSA